ncbi:MAG: response regulator [Spartobacteria bacterium]|nr:response regulator [Spartobacteria bacterium]
METALSHDPAAPAPSPGKRLKILHLEDNPVDALLVREMLAEDHVDCDLVVVMEPDEFERELAKGDVDVVISDYSLPHYCGTEALQRTRAGGAETPFIFVSGSIGEERAVEAVRLGATDYVMKENLRRLGVAVRRAVEVAESARRRREAEARLAEERDLLVDVFSSVQDGLVVLDAERKVVQTNPTIEKLFSDKLPLVGQSIDSLCPAVAEASAAAALGSGQPAPLVCSLETAAGPGDFSVYAYPLVARRSGRQKGVILYVRDITGERRLQQQLFQAQKMESIGLLAGGVAHDFNNILQAVLGFAEVLGSELAADDPARADVGEIHKATERGIALTRQLLAFSRKQVLAIEDLDLNERVRQMGNMLQRLLGARYELNCDLAPAPARIRGDAGQIEQILLNLVVNSRDAMPAGGPIGISIRGATLAEADARRRGTPWRAGRFIRLAVADAGAGIPPDVLPRLFEPFFTTKAKDKGTGLGLSTVYGIVQQHNGWIDVDSRLGRGTTFAIYFPALDDGEPA